MTCGYARAGQRTGQVSVLKYLSPICSLIWGALLLGEGLCLFDVAGCFLVIGSSMVIVYVAAAGGHATNGGDYIANVSVRAENAETESPNGPDEHCRCEGEACVAAR